MEADLRLIARIGAGDRAAFAELFQGYAPRLLGFLRSRGVESEQAEEIVQEVLLSVWRNAASFDPTRASLSTWIFTIARNRMIDRARRAAHAVPDPHDPLFQADTTLAADDAAEAAQRAVRVREAVAALPEDQRRVIERGHLGGLTLAAIALEECVPLGTVKTRARLAVERLRRVLAPRRES